MKSLFITGTDTNSGKTYISRLLLQEFNKRGFKTFAIKPLASGCSYNEKAELRNEDAVYLQEASSLYKPYQIVNPIALPAPIAPHLAAQEMGISLSTKKIKEAILSSLQSAADINLIEGVGGWLVPLNHHELFADVIQELKIPTILVVGIKLGCLNHALLTYQNIIDRQVPFIGWIANCLERDTLCIQENISTLSQWIPAPCLGVISYKNQISDCINIDIIHHFLLQQHRIP